MVFWIGLLGLVYTLFTAHPVPGAQTLRLLSRGMAGGFTLAIAIAYIASIGMYARDELFVFLQWRSPVSWVCIHAQETAPTHCHPHLIIGAIPSVNLVYEFAERLKPFGLSVFAPNQRWT